MAAFQFAAGHAMPIEELVGSYRGKRISRQQFVTALTAAGATAAGVATFIAAADHQATTGSQATAQPAVQSAATPTAPMTAADHQQAHAQHVASQVGGTSAPTAAARAAAVDKTMQDYAASAVVDGP
jgi:hypothetical protein